MHARINAFPHFRTVIDGVPIHFIHHKGVGPTPVPLIMTHGWPWTFWDMHKENPEAVIHDLRAMFQPLR